MTEPALDEILSERDGLYRDLCVELVDGLDITEGTMMGFPCLRVKGAFFASQDHRSKELIVKLDRARVAELVNTGIGEPFAPNGRVFKEWVVIAGTDEELWRHLLGEARAFCDV